MENESNNIVREEYEAPAVEDIPLRSGETLLAGCKATGGGLGPGSSSHTHACSSCMHASAS